MTHTVFIIDILISASGNSIFEDHALPGCEASEWSSWSACSVTCGKGISMRTRSFLLPEKARMLGCDRQMVQREMCSASIPLCEGREARQGWSSTSLSDQIFSRSWGWGVRESCILGVEGLEIRGVFGLYRFRAMYLRSWVVVRREWSY